MANLDNGNGPYLLDCSDAVVEELKKLQRRATRRGQGEAFVSAFRRIIRSLREDPYSTGEPDYTLPALRLQVRTVVVAPLAIAFAVNEEHRIVWIRGGKLLTALGS